MAYKNKTEKREKPVITTYEKYVTNFEEGINELAKLHPYIAEVMQFNEGEEVNPYYASSCMFNAFNNNYPDIEFGKNALWALNISANRCILKTNHKITFGWRLKYKYDRNTRTSEIIDVCMVITAFGDDVLTDQDKMTENGWTIVK